VHLLVPGGRLTQDALRWLRVKDPQLFLPQARLAARFKGRLQAWLEREQPELLQAVPAKVWWQEWVTYVQPVGSGEAALKYLAAYLSRPPLNERQLESRDAEQVKFRYRENGGASRTCRVSGEEFVRRELQHVLPKGFQRVRHYGWLGAATKAKRERIAALLDWRAPAAVPVAPVPPPQCPACGKPIRLLGELARSPPGGAVRVEPWELRANCP